MTVRFKELDVRPLLEGGGEPFSQIMSTVESLGPHEGLKLIAPFEPRPLFSVMERKGYLNEVVELDGGSFEVRFFPKGADVQASENAREPDAWPDPMIELDLIDLDPPQPMVRILDSLETMPDGAVLFAVLAREPIFLFPELIKRGHQWVGNHDNTGSAFRIMIRRGGAAR
jgi:TusA-related sulfurtransferase